MDPEFQRAQDARVPYLSPANNGDADGRHVRVPSDIPLAETYARQEHTSLRRGMRAVVRARLDQTVPTPAPEEFYGITKWLITAWNPLGEVCSLEQNVERTQRLITRIKAETTVFGEVVATTPPDRSWVEDTVLFAGCTPEETVEIAREFGQPAVTAWRDSYLTVFPTGLVDDLDVVTREAVVELRPQTCPMRVDDLDDARCAMHGGPYGSRAIHASAVWASHRELLLPRLGCDPCADGTEPTLGPLGKAGGPILVGDIGLASRYGGYVWS